MSESRVERRNATRWVITGGCGFIGRSLLSKLIGDKDLAIRVVDNGSVGSRADLEEIGIRCREGGSSSRSFDDERWEAGVELITADILDAVLAQEVVRGADVIVHLAANTGVQPSVEDPRADCLTNVIGTLNYLEAARLAGVGRFIFASSGAPIGECKPPIHEEMAPHPASPYGASKLSGEGYCSAYFHTFGVETVALRFGNVYGPNSKHKSSAIAKFIKSALEGNPIEIFGDGKQTRDFIFVEDLVAAIILAAKTPAIGGQTFQIATAAETTVEELVEQLRLALIECGLPAPVVLHSERRIGDVQRNFSDTTKAQRVLGWKAETELVEGLRRTVSWFLQKADGRYSR